MENKEKKDLELTAEEVENVNGGAAPEDRPICPFCGHMIHVFTYINGYRCCPACKKEYPF